MALLFLLVYPSDIRGQMWRPESGQNPAFFVNGSLFYQPDAHVKGGGDIAVSRYSLTARYSTPDEERVSLGLSLSYELDDYNFSRLSSFAVPDPWNKINRVGLNARVSYRLSQVWSLFAVPMGQYAGEEGADFGRSLIYGGAAGAVYRPSNRFMIGFGAAVFYRLEEVTFFPAFIFSWMITDKLRLGNSFRTGPTGPAGVELAYTVDRNWEAAVAGGYRTERFRLDEHGSIPNGIGQNQSWPFFARLSRKFGSHVRADLYGGAAFSGKLRLENSHGHKIDQVSYNTAPLAGLSLSMAY